MADDFIADQFNAQLPDDVLGQKFDWPDRLIEPNQQTFLKCIHLHRVISEVLPMG